MKTQGQTPPKGPLFQTADDLLNLLKRGLAPIAYRSQPLSKRLSPRLRQRLKVEYRDAEIVKVKTNDLAVMLALVKNEQKAKETLKLIERQGVTGSKIISYLMSLMPRATESDRPRKPHKPLKHKPGARGQTDDDLLELLKQGWAPIRYRARKVSGKPKRKRNPKTQAEHGPRRRITVKVHGHGHVTFAFVKNEARANELLDRIKRRKDKKRPIAALMVGVMSRPRGVWARSFKNEPREPDTREVSE